MCDHKTNKLSCASYEPSFSDFRFAQSYTQDNQPQKIFDAVNEDNYNNLYALRLKNPRNRWMRRLKKCSSAVHQKIETKRRVSQVRKTKSEDSHNFNENFIPQTTNFINQLTPSNVTSCEESQHDLRNSVSEPNIFIRREAAGQNFMSNFIGPWTKSNDFKENACSSKKPHLKSSSSCESMQDEFEDRLNTSDHDYARIGHRIPDDMINLYCERLQSARAPVEKIQGLMAMQFLTCDPDSVRNHINGKHRVFQVIFDSERSHYVLLEYVVRENCVRLYDSMLPSHWSANSVRKLFHENVRCQIRSLFAHLFPAGQVPVLVVCGLETQDDGWSCGFRVIFYLTLRLFSREVENYNINIENTAKFFNKIIDYPKPSLNQFRIANLGDKRQKPRETQYIRVQINKSSVEIFL